jgi:hypothetical protein
MNTNNNNTSRPTLSQRFSRGQGRPAPQGRGSFRPQISQQALVGALKALKPAAQSRPRPQARRPRQNSGQPDTDRSGQVGAVVSTKLIRLGMSDLRSHRIAWTAGTIFVGNGTNGIANSVYFLTATGTYLARGFSAGASGMVPIVASDAQLGAAFIKDVEKHFARKVIKRMWIHLISLQPSTANNMMVVVAPSRGGGGVEWAIFDALATAAEPANTVINVTSMKGSFPCDSWQNKSVEITSFIAGGSGARQNEFDLDTIVSGNAAGSVINPGLVTGVDGDGDIPACFAVAGNSTTAALQNTNTHLVVIEQEVDYLDYIGGMSQILPIV